MTNKTVIIFTALILTVSCAAVPAAHAQSIASDPTTASVAADQFSTVLEQAVIEQELAQQEPSAGSIAFDDDEEESEKVYRYDDGMGEYYGAELPVRSFNNIRYPY